VAGFVMGGCIEIGEEGVVVCCRKNTLGRSRNGGGGEEGRAPDHILNIIDRFINGIISMVTSSTILSISMPHHCTICKREMFCFVLKIK
jgi:hypothetical protein